MSTSSYIFDGPSPDVILRAPLEPGSDESKDFHVHKIILSIASTVFQYSFSTPQPPRHTSKDTTLEVVQISEPAKVLEIFLQLVYPVDSPVVEDLWLVGDLLQLADKYAAKGVTTRLKKLLVSPSFLKDNPIGVFAIACRSNLEEEANQAVPHTFSTDVVRGVSEEHLQVMTTKTYHRLLTEHALRRERLINAAEKAQAWLRCSCRGLKSLTKDIRLEVYGRPFLDREILDKCLNQNTIRNTCHSPDFVTRPGQAAQFLADIIHRAEGKDMDSIRF